MGGYGWGVAVCACVCVCVVSAKRASVVCAVCVCGEKTRVWGGGGMQALAKQTTSTTDHLTTLDEYNSNKVAIRRLLCRKNDPTTAYLAPGEHSPDLAPRFLRDRLAELRASGVTGFKMVRGFKLVTIGLPGSKPSFLTFNAASHVVLQHPDGSFESVTRNGDDVEGGKYIFVPSSRMHADLTDDELLSGYWLLSTVVSGPPSIISTLVRIRSAMCSFEQRRLCGSPEDARARRSIVFRYFPSYLKWVSKKSLLQVSIQTDATVAFGIPHRELTDEEFERVFDGGDADQKQITEVVSCYELTNPKEPWGFEKERWLPSVAVLHALVDEVVMSDEPHSEENEKMLFALYDVLQDEYATRLSSMERKCRTEMCQSRLHGFR